MHYDLDIPVPDDQLRLAGPIGWGALVMLLFFLLLGGWAAMVPLGSSIMVSGIVEVKQQRKVVQHLEGGIVEWLGVQDGSRVKAGDLLLSLDATQAQARHALFQERLASRLALAARLEAERDARPITFAAYAAELATASGRNAMAVQSRIFEARERALKGQTAILQRRIDQSLEEIQGLEQLVMAHDRLILTLDEEAHDLEGLFSQGLTTRERYMALRRREAELEGERAIHIASIARARKMISELEQQIAELSVARLNQAVEELSKTEVETMELRQQIIAASDVLRRADIRAPLSGTVMNLKVHSERGVIAPGETLMELVPDDANVVVKARVRPEDIAQVRVDQAVEVRLRFHPGDDPPALHGNVRDVSADRLADDRTGEGFFLIIIEIATSGDTDLRISPGMAADIALITESRTMLQYLSAPLLRGIRSAMRES